MIDGFIHNKKRILSWIIFILLIFVIYASRPFISAVFGAIILATIVHPIFEFFTNLKLSKKTSAVITIVISLILIIIPLMFIAQGLLNQISILGTQSAQIESFENNLREKLNININIDEKNITNQITKTLSGSIRPILSSAGNIAIILFLLFFLLYYILIYYDELEERIHDALPLKSKNKKLISEKFRQVTNSSIIGTILIALIQSSLMTLNLYFLQIPNALFWGFITFILAFLPILGPPVFWIPASLILYVQGQMPKAIVLVFAGILISLVDNIIRPAINKRYGKIHPVVSIIGIYIGVSQFGIVGIFIGPLIIAYLLLFWKIYRENYLD